MKTVKVRISPDGSIVEVDVDGVQGSSCKDLTEGLIKAIGEVDKSEHKPEFYQEVGIDVNVGH